MTHFSVAQEQFLDTVLTHMHGILSASTGDEEKIQRMCPSATPETCRGIASLSNWFVGEQFVYVPGGDGEHLYSGVQNKL